ncbi:MAG: anthranilate phosphoribosyltransferase [Gammaproteobacteria bacterium]|nr:MAG: anthranilate phosphoribosyltransferase [Gammaproteobacteria bacterium]
MLREEFTKTFPAQPDNWVDETIRNLIQKVATGAGMSRNLCREEAESGMRLLLDKKIPDVQAAVFLVGLRMKRETDEELSGMLDALLTSPPRIFSSTEELLHISDNYNGYARYLPVSPFLPPLLASCGVPTLIHGTQGLGPKFGLTASHVYSSAHVKVDMTTTTAMTSIENRGWAYIDQTRFHPKLSALLPLRNLIIKRTALHTLEGFCCPVQGRKKTHYMGGYVHQNYLPSYLHLARQSGYHSALIVRGLEGGCIPLLHKRSYFGHYDSSAEDKISHTGHDLLSSSHLQSLRIRKNPKESLQDCMQYGIDALRGRDSPFRMPLLLTVALVLKHLGRVSSLEEGQALANQKMKNGQAIEYFNASS